MNRHLHIVCLDVPWPADYGAAIDMLYKIRALHAAGIRIHLHYYSYNHRGNPNELNRFCESIHVYERKTGHRGFSLKLPYIVCSRLNDQLSHNLQKDNHPVILEGVHTTGVLKELDLKNRAVLVRLQNYETQYYRQMARLTPKLFKKAYFYHESLLLHHYENGLPNECLYACVTQEDLNTFRNRIGLEKAFYLPVFTPYSQVNSMEGMGNFCLYHGNLSVPENEKAALWLLTKVFSRINFPFVIAGKNPSSKLEKIARKSPNTCLVANPTETEINDLVKKAHINILPSFTNTGIKHKLLHAIFEGRHCVTNDAMVAGTGLETACHIGSNADALASIITQLQHRPFSEEEINLRKHLAGNTFNNTKNAESLIACLY